MPSRAEGPSIRTPTRTSRAARGTVAESSIASPSAEATGTHRDARRKSSTLEEQTARRRELRPPVLKNALPHDAVDRMRSATDHREHRDHGGPKHAEFVTAFRQRPYIADLKMSAPQHRHQQIHRSEQGNGAREESQREADGANELDRSAQYNLCGGHMKPQAREIERVDLELKGPAEDVTPEMRHEHQTDIDSDKHQCRGIERYFSRIRRRCALCRAQDKMD